MSAAPPVREWGPHLHGVGEVPGVNDVEWSRTKEVRERLKEAVLDRGLVSVIGPVGTGKTFSVARAAESCADLVDEVVWLEVASTLRGRALFGAFYERLCGGAPPKGATEYQLMRQLRHTMATQRRLVILDEAQYVTHQALQALRGFHSDANADFALVVIGTPELARRMPPELRSRVTGQVRFERIADAEAPKVLAAFHPRYTATEPAVLREANRRYARGEFRWWAKLLVPLNRYEPEGAKLTLATIARYAERLP